MLNNGVAPCFDHYLERVGACAFARSLHRTDCDSPLGVRTKRSDLLRGCTRPDGHRDGFFVRGGSVRDDDGGFRASACVLGNSRHTARHSDDKTEGSVWFCGEAWHFASG